MPSLTVLAHGIGACCGPGNDDWIRLYLGGVAILAAVALAWMLIDLCWPRRVRRG